MTVDHSVWNKKSWIPPNENSCLASKDERYVMRIHPGLWRVFPNTFVETPAAVEQLEDSQSVRKQSHGAVQSAEFSCQSTLQPTTWNTARSVRPAAAPHTHLGLYFTWRVEQTQYVSWAIWRNEFSDKSKLWVKHCSLMLLGGETLNNTINSKSFGVMRWLNQSQIGFYLEGGTYSVVLHVAVSPVHSGASFVHYRLCYKPAKLWRQVFKTQTHVHSVPV